MGWKNDVDNFAGKSRADLWELAALVALDLTVERANRACDLDFHARHQVSLQLFLSNFYLLLLLTTSNSFDLAWITITGDFVGKQREMRNQADKATKVPNRCFNYRCAMQLKCIFRAQGLHF